MNIKTKHVVIAFVVILVLVIVPVSVFYGYRTFLSPKDTTTQSVVPSIEKNEPAISNKEDLSKAVDQLNEVDTSTKQEENKLRQIVQ